MILSCNKCSEKLKSCFLLTVSCLQSELVLFFSITNEQVALDRAVVDPIAETKAKIDREIVNKSILHRNAMAQQM